MALWWKVHYWLYIRGPLNMTSKGALFVWMGQKGLSLNISIWRAGHEKSGWKIRSLWTWHCAWCHAETGRTFPNLLQKKVVMRALQVPQKNLWGCSGLLRKLSLNCCFDLLEITYKSERIKAFPPTTVVLKFRLSEPHYGDRVYPHGGSVVYSNVCLFWFHRTWKWKSLS